MRVLVTGGAGFIASHVADKVLAAGHEVTILDDLSTGKRRNIPGRAEFHEMDIRDGALTEVFHSFRPDIVFHHAAQMDVRKSVAEPTYDADVNILGTLNLLESCRRHGTRKVIYAGTGGAMFGEAEYIPVDERHPVNPISPYGITKHTVEHYLHAYRTNFELDFTVLRYPNVYGPRQDPYGEAGVVAIFSLQLLRGERPTIFGDGGKTRDYCYVDDIVEANMLALDRGSGSIYNLGRSIEVSDQQIFEAVRDAVGVDIEPIYAPRRPGEVERIALDATAAGDALGWRWKTPVDAGVARAVDYYKTLQKKEDSG